MRQILLLTSADMSLQTGNVVLIRRRAQAIYAQLGIHTTCIMLKQHPHFPSASGGISFSVALDTNSLVREIESIETLEFVVLYGRKAWQKIDVVKSVLHKLGSRALVIIDVQGALEENFEHSAGLNRVVNLAKYLVKKHIFTSALNKANGVFVVSDELSAYCGSKMKSERDQNFRTYKIRCGVDEVINTEQKAEWRKESRRVLKISENETVYVFSGHRMPWQKIEQTIELFQELDRVSQSSVFAFFCNLDKQFISRIREAFPKGNFVMKHLNEAEYFRYLCACDVGFLLRDYNITNHVAFPNKFSDYLNAGLIVATNSAIPEPYRILSSAKIDFIDLESDDLYGIIAKVQKRKQDLSHYYENSEALCRRELLYARQVEQLFVDH